MAEDKDKIYPPPRPTAPKQAPWTDVQELINRLDRLTTTLESWVSVAAPAAPGAPGPTIVVEAAPGAPAPTEVTVSTPWKAQDIVEIYKENPRAAGTFYSPKMLDFRNGKRLILHVHSTLDQSIQVTVTGNLRDSRGGIVEKGSAVPCEAKTDIEIGLAWDDFTCFVGVKIVISTAPTEGALLVEGVVQE